MVSCKRLAASRRQCLFFNACLFCLFICTVQIRAIAGADPEKCDQDGSLLNLRVTGNSSVEFKCGGAVPNLHPNPGKTPPIVCENSSCTNEVPLNIPNATLVKDSSGKATFTVSDASVGATTVYLKCSSLANTAARVGAGQPGQEAEKEKTCIVQTSVWGPPIKGSKEYPTPDACKNGTLSLEVNPSKKSVTFACGDNETLSPELFDMVFSTKECTTSSTLAEHLSGASLVQHARTNAADDKKPAYTFSVTSLPTEEKTLCYQCTKKNAQMKGEAQNTCKVLIKVAKQETDTGSTTVAPPNESRAEHGQWNTALMVSLITIPVVLMKML
ncbi:SAG-related sequence SRS20A [Toxoplasma gondii VAND]|uniref:SAG-related sequence SRS20A n=1 Tax=Toxoplasma gondii VAND TaxID=933077 RepID=A0A086Q6X6_TOXGO|nr:SAG-related sequence SRS20A [Toxoplasma gondii VAND]